MMELYIFGFGGFAREVLTICRDLNYEVKGFVDNVKNCGASDNIINYYEGIPVYNEVFFDCFKKNIVIAVGNLNVREKIYHKLKSCPGVFYPNIISPKSNILNSNSITMGEGIIICPGCILTCDIHLGDFVNLNLNSTIGHNSYLDSFTTTATNVSISGDTIIGKRVYFGNNSCVKENIIINNDVIIGMGGVVVKDIKDSGIYVGNPVKKLEK